MIAEYLKKQRIKKLLTQDQVAKSLGVTKTYYNLLETGKKKPGMKTMIKIAELYKTSRAYIVRLAHEDNK